MRPMHVGLRVEDLDESVAFCSVRPEDRAERCENAAQYIVQYIA